MNAETTQTNCPLTAALKKGESLGLCYRITVPRYPYVRPGEQTPIQSVRVGQAEAGDLKLITSECRKSAFWVGRTERGEWSAIAVLSAYTSRFHAMLMETSPDRYIPDPRFVADDQGAMILGILASMAQAASESSPSGAVSVGFNCSPLGWGSLEAKAGLQSVLSKVHFHVWAWTPPPPIGARATEGAYEVEWI
jgi:hypothetical protein